MAQRRLAAGFDHGGNGVIEALPSLSAMVMISAMVFPLSQCALAAV